MQIGIRFGLDGRKQVHERILRRREGPVVQQLPRESVTLSATEMHIQATGHDFVSSRYRGTSTIGSSERDQRMS